ncbi:MAG: GMC family oxidoreductase [Deltaproteobacteria bacterium]|nr:GMC family oxidoreductase [Deltaproteobacteria bacterium]
MSVNSPPIVFGSGLLGTRRERCDVCVIGSGPGGAVVAEALTARGRDVLIVEIGGMPQSQPPLAPEDVVLRYYRDAGVAATIWPAQIPIPTGRAFGGTSVINSGTCLATPEPILARWASELGVDFPRDSWRAAEAEIADELSIRPCPEASMGASNRLFAEGLRRLGRTGGAPLPRCEVECVGSGRCVSICPRDAKQAVQLNYLRKARDHGLRVYLETEARHLRFHGNAARSLVCRTAAGGRVVIEAQHFVCALGALDTPSFLLRHTHGRRLAALGRHLSIHPAVKIFAVMPTVQRAWEGVPQAFGYHDPALPDCCFEGVFLPPSMSCLSLPFLGDDLIRWMRCYDRMVAFGFCIADSQHGRLVPAPQSPPLIWYDLTPRDLDNFFHGMRLIAEAYFAVGAEHVILPVLNPPNVFASWASFDAGFRRDELRKDSVLGMAFHPLGTCRFAADPARGAISATGRLHGVDNVSVADGSAIAGPLGVNPQVTIMAFAKHVARSL